MNWKKSTRCETSACVEVAFRAVSGVEDALPRCETGDCVEISHADGLVLVRDSKNPDTPPITFLPWQWNKLVDHVKTGVPLQWSAVFFPLVFDESEIDAFVKGAAAGEFDLEVPDVG